MITVLPKNLRKEQVKKGMKKNNKGFTLAELLIVIAIIVILMGVAFVAVQNYQRSSTRLEFDGIAKEIFIAAQNHLTTAESQGYLQLSSESNEGEKAKKLGSEGNSDADTKDERYFVYKAVNKYSTNPQKAESVLDLMLPFGAIDETVRAGGTYIIRYQPSSGRVLDVFYSQPGKSSLLTVSGVELSADDYGPLMTGYRDNAKTRERFNNSGRTGVVGWYGGEEGLPTGTRLAAPEIIVHNEELLWVEVTDNNNGVGSLKLIITGVTSGAQTSFERNDSNENERVKKSDNDFYVILDDLTTSGLHFADLESSSVDENGNLKSFIPGEDIIIEAVAYNNEKITNVAFSGQKRTNSLFAETEKETVNDSSKYVALIENFRHFENLDQTISGFSYNGAIKKENEDGNEEDTYETISKARQIKNLNWTEKSTDTLTEKPDSFVEAVMYIKNSIGIETPTLSSLTIFTKENLAAATDSLYPVSPTYVLEYDGKSNSQSHKVSNVVVSGSTDAGLFGSISVANSEIKNLKLIDFTVSGTATAGALIGSATNTTITNVVVHNSIDKTTGQEKLAKNIESTSGITGGLIGSMNSGTVMGCAAAVYVSGGTNAGGLIGKAESGTVTACYSGGHTDGPDNGTATYYTDGKATYDETSEELTNGIYNVVVSEGGYAGGLIGNAGNADISSSYSTCSVKGTTVGGLIGSGSGTVTACYATGLVSGGSDATTGAFAGTFTGAIETVKGKESYYYQVINEIRETDGTISYLPPVGSADSTGVKALDENADSYNEFVGSPVSSAEKEKDWADASPYDTDLENFYQKMFPLRTVVRLGAVLPTEEGQNLTDWFVTTHYGDWPAPEIFVINSSSNG